MEQYFASLSKRQTMLLLTTVTFGGAEGGSALEGLPPAEAELLKHRAEQMLQIPREKRIPLLVQEIKRLVTQRKKQLTHADPDQLAALLEHERPTLVEVVLRALPAQLADPVRAQLPHHQVELRREVRPEILNIVRWKLEELLEKQLPPRGVFQFADLLVLQSRELVTVCDRMGARVLATALAGLPQEEREGFLDGLPPDQRQLAAKAAAAGASRRLSEDDARTMLQAHDAMNHPSAGMRSAGAQRLARACLAQGPDFAGRLIERHPGELGRLLSRWVKEERHRPIRGDGGRADIVEQLERLAQKGLVDRPLRLPPPPRANPSLPGGHLLPPPPSSAGVPPSGMRRSDPHLRRPISDGPSHQSRALARELLAPRPPKPGAARPTQSRSEAQPERAPRRKTAHQEAIVGRPRPGGGSRRGVIKGSGRGPKDGSG